MLVLAQAPNFLVMEFTHGKHESRILSCDDVG
jgi:hypothetical protein